MTPNYVRTVDKECEIFKKACGDETGTSRKCAILKGEENRTI